MFGINTRFLSLSRPNGNALTITGTATVSDVADILGGTTAGEYDFGATSSGTLLTLSAGSGVSSLVAGDVVWAGFYVKSASSQAMDKVLVNVRMTLTGGTSVTTQHEIVITSEYRLTLIPTPLRHTVTAFSVTFESSSHVTLGSKDKIVIDRPHIYRATQPIPHDTVRTISTDADYTLKAHYAGPVVIRHNVALAAARTITLDWTNAVPGVTKFHIQRTSAATGAFSLIIGTTGVSLAAAGDRLTVTCDNSGTTTFIE